MYGTLWFWWGKIHFEGHWKGWALKIETFLGPEMATSEAKTIWAQKSLRLINTCRKVPLHVHLFRWRHFALPSMSLSKHSHFWTGFAFLGRTLLPLRNVLFFQTKLWPPIMALFQEPNFARPDTQPQTPQTKLSMKGITRHKLLIFN